MKLLVLVALVGLVGLIEASKLVRPARAVATSDQEASVVRSESEVKLDGFNYVYETNNGISAQATGSLQKVADGEALTVQGQYQYTAPDGTPVQLSYVADHDGYKPSGAHIPTPPPTPDYILRSLEYIAAHPAPVDKRP